MPAQGPCPACGGQLVQVERMDAQTAMKLFKDYQSHKTSKSKHRKKSILDELFG